MNQIIEYVLVISGLPFQLLFPPLHSRRIHGPNRLQLRKKSVWLYLIIVQLGFYFIPICYKIKNGEGEGKSTSREEIVDGGFGSDDAINAHSSAVDASWPRNPLSPHWLRRGIFPDRRSNQVEALDYRHVIPLFRDEFLNVLFI